MKPRLLDLFSGAGGSAYGYHRAGFDVVGVDIRPQPHYLWEHHVADALTFPLEGFDAVHASPPCQAFTKAQRLRGRDHPDLIEATRTLLVASGVPWVIENVPGSPLIDPITLCGLMFGLDVDRDRLFESSFPMTPPEHPRHNYRKAKMGRPPKRGEIIQVVGHFSNVKFARRAMDISWMTRDELNLAVPPAYTEWVGKQLMSYICGPQG